MEKAVKKEIRDNISIFQLKGDHLGERPPGAHRRRDQAALRRRQDLQLHDQDGGEDRAAQDPEAHTQEEAAEEVQDGTGRRAGIRGTSGINIPVDRVTLESSITLHTNGKSI